MIQKIKQVIYFLFKKFSINKRTILFIGYYGSSYGCNPKYISEYIVRHFGYELNVIWAFTNPKVHRIEGVKKVKFGSLSYLYALATSRFVCSNYRMNKDFQKRSDQIYIQTWHSSLRLKMIEKDALASLPVEYVEMAMHDSAQTDFVIAGCKKSAETFQNSFWFDGEILKIGTPRNDLLINADETQKFVVKQSLGIPYDTKVLLYAPTFREDKSIQYYNLDFCKIKKTLALKFGGTWQVMIRLHPHLSTCTKYQNCKDVIDTTTYDDIQELLLISDALLTDYSSLMFDFSITGKPIFLYTPDLEKYCSIERALYFDIKKLPFPYAFTQYSLLKIIENFNKMEYSNKLKYFDDTIGSFENGTASKAVCELILKYIDK